MNGVLRRSNRLPDHKRLSNFTGNIFSFLSPKDFASRLENCSNVDSLKKLHACLIIRGLERNAYLCPKLINSLARFNLLSESRCVLNKFIDGSDSISVWTSVMIGYFRANQYSEVLRFYSNLRRRKIAIDCSSIVYGLKSSVELGIHEFGVNLHSDGLKLGLNRDRILSSSLIGFYSKFDRIGDACKVFGELPDRDVVAYTSIITAYARAGDLYANDAFRVVLEMQRHGFEPNRVTLVSLLQLVSRLGAAGRGKSIHGYAIRKGIGCGDEVFETSLMDMYARMGDIRHGFVVFDKVEMKSTASWNALIARVLSTGQVFEALNLFHRMASEKYELDLISLANGLMIGADLEDLHLGKSIHCCVVRKGVQLDLVSTTALIDMYCKCKHLSGAMNVFNQTEDKDGILFGVMLAGYLHNGFVLKAIKMFHEMVALGTKPSPSAVIHVLSTLSDLKDVRGGKSVHAYAFRQNLEANTDIANQFISMYSKCGLIRCARLVFDRIKNKDRVSWASIMTGLVNHSLADKSIALFRWMQRENVSPDSITFICLMQAVNQLGFVAQAREVHGYLYRTFQDNNITLMNSLITAYSKGGKLKTASDIFEHMTKRHLSSWNTMIAAYGMNGNCIKALSLFDQMKSANLCPDNVTFKSVLSACSHAGFIQEGLNAFNSMEELYGVVPSDEHYGCVVDMLGRAGCLEEAYNILQHTPSRQNASTLGALLAACRIHGNSDMGERVGKWLLEVEPESASAYCSVSNLYARGGRWDAVATIGAMAKEKGLRRTTGYSLVDVI